MTEVQANNYNLIINEFFKLGMYPTSDNSRFKIWYSDDCIYIQYMTVSSFNLLIIEDDPRIVISVSREKYSDCETLYYDDEFNHKEIVKEFCKYIKN